MKLKRPALNANNCVLGATRQRMCSDMKSKVNWQFGGL